METDGMSPRRAAKRPRVEWAGHLRGRARKINSMAGLPALYGLKLGRGALWLREHWGNVRMRIVVFTAAALAVAGAAHAQFQPIQPIPAIPSIPAIPGGEAPREPRGQAYGGFTPYKPPSYMRPNLPTSPADPYPHMRRTPGVQNPETGATPADPYPGLHPRHKHNPNSF